MNFIGRQEMQTFELQSYILQEPYIAILFQNYVQILVKLDQRLTYRKQG